MLLDERHLVSALEIDAVVDKTAQLTADNELLRTQLLDAQRALESHECAASNLRLTGSDGEGAIPQWSDGSSNSPHKGWHYVLGGPGYSYTMPECDDGEFLSWWVWDNDGKCWVGHQELAARIVATRETESEMLKVCARGPFADVSVRIVIHPSDEQPGVWVGRHLDSDVVSQGSAPGEALELVLAALALVTMRPAP